jgi:myo-inositol 2-dehydrogenase/D-chiro-inositol 1-dehydrogenase
MTKLKIGIIGAGYMGGLHAKLLARDERVRVEAIYDVVGEYSQARAREFGAEAVESIAALIERVDAVYITTPNTLHVEATLCAVEAGRNVFCEKPLATSLDEARRVLDAAGTSRAVFQVGHNRRFAPVYQTVKRLIEEQRLAPHSIHAKMNRGELINPSWVGDARLTGGFLYETTIHVLDMLRWLFGDVTSVIVHATAHEYREIDDFSMLFRFASGVHATLASSADASWHFPFERLEIFCHHATIETEEMERLSYTLGLDSQAVTESFDQLERERRWGYEQEDKAFIDVILNGEPAPVTALDGYKAVELADACYRAAQTGEECRLEQSEEVTDK